MLEKNFVSLLCCPETKAAVQEADSALVSKVNEKIRSGQMRNRAGTAVKETIEGGLLREDRQFLYPVRNHIPVMLIDEALPVADLMS
jgi:uncharacterized protein YbaR (Trm112 family)